MARFSVSLDDEQTAWLEAEADRRNRSQAAIVRECIDAVRTGEHQSGAEHTEPVHTDVVQRLERLESIVDELGDGVDTDTDTNGDGEPETPVTDEQARLEPREQPSSAVEPQGSGVEKAVVQWVRANQPASRADIVEAFADEIEELGIKPKSWWVRHARPELKAAGADFERNVGWWI